MGPPAPVCRRAGSVTLRGVADDRPHRTWLSSDRFLPTRFLRPVLRFTEVESAGGLALLAAAVAALVWANLPGGESYERFWETPIDFTLGPLVLHETLRGLVDHGLMTLFFFVVGLEIKRELVRGELRDFRTAALPSSPPWAGWSSRH